jgi:hypothetical protein
VRFFVAFLGVSECNRDVTLTNHLERTGLLSSRVECERHNLTGRVAVAVVKIVLSGLAATFVALLGPGFVTALRYVSPQKATGLAAVAGGLLEAIFSPLFWVLAIFSFALFFTASRLRSKVLQVILFWAPTVIISTLGFGLFALLAYAWLHFRKG